MMDRRLVLLLTLAACSTTTADPGDGGGGSGPPKEIPCAEPGRRPGLRADHDAVYVKSMDTIVVFGGDRAPFDPSVSVEGIPSSYTDEIWHYQVGCGAWSRVDAGMGPARRGAYAAAVDEKRERVIVVGGRSGTEGAYRVNDDVWAYLPRTQAWQRLYPEGTPPNPRDGHRMVYDPARDRVVMFGGNEDRIFGNAVRGDTWELSFASGENGTWRLLTRSGPDPRQDFALTHDASRGVALMFGGAANIFSYFNDVWAYEMATDEWRFVVMKEDVTPGLEEPTPAPRFWPELVASGDGVFFLFGGHDPYTQGNRNDLWRIELDAGLERGTWKRLLAGDIDLETPETTSPERRSEHSFVWTPGGPWLFGGTTDCGPTDDVWTFGTGGWQPVLPATVGETCVRRKTDPSDFCEYLSCAAPVPR